MCRRINRVRGVPSAHAFFTESYCACRSWGIQYLLDRYGIKEKYQNDDMEIIPVIGDVQDRERMFDIVEKYQPTIIYHAAAHKHVPLMEYNPHEAVKNNVIGTKNTAEAAATFGVETFVMVSTD